MRYGKAEKYIQLLVNCLKVNQGKKHAIRIKQIHFDGSFQVLDLRNNDRLFGA